MTSMYSRVGNVTLPFPQKNNSRNGNAKPTTLQVPQKATRRSFSVHKATGSKTKNPTFNQHYQDERGLHHNSENRRALPPQDTIRTSDQPHHHQHQDMEISQLTTCSEEFSTTASANCASFGMLSNHQIGFYGSQGSRRFGQDDQGTLAILSGSYSPNESEQNEDGPETLQLRQPSQSQGSLASSSSSSSTAEGYDSQKRQHRSNQQEERNAAGHEASLEHSAAATAGSLQVPPQRGPHQQQRETRGFQNARTEEARLELADSQPLRQRSARDFQASANRPRQFGKTRGGDHVAENTSASSAQPRDAKFQPSTHSAGLYGDVRMRQHPDKNFRHGHLQEQDGVTTARHIQKQPKQKGSYLASLNNLGNMSHTHSNRTAATAALQSNIGKHFGKLAHMEGLQNDRTIVSLPGSVSPRQVEELRSEFFKHRDESNARMTEQAARVDSLIQEMQSLSKDHIGIVTQTAEKADEATKAKEEAQTIVKEHKDCVNTTVKLIREMGASEVKAIQEAGIAAESEQQKQVAEIRTITTESKQSLEKTRDSLLQSFCTAICDQLSGLQEVVNGGWSIFLPNFKSFMESHTWKEADVELPTPPEDERRKSTRKKGPTEATSTVIVGKKCVRLPQQVQVASADPNERNSISHKEGASRVPSQNTLSTASKHKLRRSKREKSAVYKEPSRVGGVYADGPPVRVRKSQKETKIAKNSKTKRPSEKKRTTGYRSSDTSTKGLSKKKKKKKNVSPKQISSPQVTHRGLTKKANQITPVALAPSCFASGPSTLPCERVDDHRSGRSNAESPTLTKGDISFVGAPLIRAKNKKKRKRKMPTPVKLGKTPDTADPVKRQKLPTPVSLGKGFDPAHRLVCQKTPEDPFAFDDMV